MPYLIDGHNLIPKIPGLSLHLADDEAQLVTLLSEFCRLQRKTAEVYFDNAAPGQSNRKKVGRVTVHFIRQGDTADNQISRRLRKMAGEARNWTVVSSDQAVQAAARQVKAAIIASEEFAQALTSTPRGSQTSGSEHDLPKLSPEEVDAWLSEFGERTDRHRSTNAHPNKKKSDSSNRNF